MILESGEKRGGFRPHTPTPGVGCAHSRAMPRAFGAN